VTGSAEFKLAIECCRSSFRNLVDRGAVPTPVEVDWARFLDLTRFHRIEGLAWNYLSAKETGTPEEIRTTLSEAASGIAAQNLQANADCRTLLGAFEAAKVPLLFLKGLTLGALAYGNPSLKAAIDIDLLIDPANLDKAAELLRDSGYRLTAPAESPNDGILHAWHRGWKESVWAKDSPPLQIDLHTRTADNRRLIPGIDVHSPSQWVDVGGGIHLPTLANDALFAYLAVHGASSAWFRLKWIADFAGLVEGRSATEIDQLYRRSQQLGAGRAAGQALLLADALFGVLEPNPALRDELIRNRSTLRLYRAALRLLTGEPSARRGGTMTIHWTQFLLLPGPGYKLSELWRQAKRLLARVA
jgi:hypothetical protein